MVNWVEVDGKIDNVETVRLNGMDILNSEFDYESKVGRVVKDGAMIEFSLSPIIVPLGKLGNIAYREKDREVIVQLLEKYWKYVGSPEIYVDFIISEGKKIQIRAKYLRETKSIIDIRDIIKEIQSNCPVNRIIVGMDGDNLEFQFLDREKRTEIREGDFVDFGIFISINGDVKISAGVNRLICTNGLVEKMTIWNGINVREGKEYFERGKRLVEWLKHKSEEKVGDIRELSVIFEGMPIWIKNRFWKSWSEKIFLKELTYFDVISDVTMRVNNTLSSVRYRILEAPVYIGKIEERRCPVCSAKIGGVKND